MSEAELAGMSAPSAQLVALTPEMMKELSSDEIYKIYQTYVKELSVKLVDVNQAGDGPSAAELERLVRDLVRRIMQSDIRELSYLC